MPLHGNKDTKTTKRHSTSESMQNAELLKKCGEFRGGNPSIAWHILGHAAAYTPEAKKCNLCLTEKLYIAENYERLINKRDELVSKCRHQNKFIVQLRKRKKDNVTSNSN